MFKILKSKRGSVIGGAFICIMIILLAFTLMQLTYIFNSHYKATRTFEHTLTLLETNIQKDAYDSLRNYDVDNYKNQIENSLYRNHTSLKDEYIKLLEKNSDIKYDKSAQKIIGDHYEIKLSDIKIDCEVESSKKDSYVISFHVTSNINYTTQIFFTDKPITASTGNIDFTSKYEFINDLGKDSQAVAGNGNDTDKYNNIGG